MDHAWRYFELHAGQRMSTFNYFLVVFGIVSAGLAGCLRADGIFRLMGAALGVCLIVVAVAFWKLEQRVAFLIKHAEDALRQLELVHVVDSARLFQKEPEHTRETQAMSSAAKRIWTYGKSFRIVYGLAMVVGLAGLVLSIVLYTMT